MILGTVIGTVVASQKHAKIHGRKLLLVQPHDASGTDTGPPLLTVDTVGAGLGERVLVVVEGRSTSQAMGVDRAPADAAIVGIIDSVNLDVGVFEGTSTSEDT